MFKKLLISGLYATHLLTHVLLKQPRGFHAAKIIPENFIFVNVNELSEKLMLSIRYITCFSPITWFSLDLCTQLFLVL